MAGAKSEIAERLAARLKEARRAQGLSLEALAERSGVSRSMLSAIERAESSPTVASLWNLTQALQTDFSGLLDEEAGADRAILEIIRVDQAPVIQSCGEGCRITILSPPEDVGETEVYDIRLEAAGDLTSAPHRDGAVEHLTVLDGRLTVSAGDASAELRAGETIRYRADLPHAIRATGCRRPRAASGQRRIDLTVIAPHAGAACLSARSPTPRYSSPPEPLAARRHGRPLHANDRRRGTSDLLVSIRGTRTPAAGLRGRCPGRG